MSQNSPLPIRIMLADDHFVVRQGLRAFLGSCDGIEVVGDAGTGAEALALCAAEHPDVALLDMRMPDGDGIETTRQILLQSPRTRVIILTSYVGPEYVAAAVRAGALSYLLKDTSAPELLHAVRAAAQGQPTFSPRATAQMMQLVVAAQEKREAEKLSQRELEVLRYLAEGFTNSQVAARLFLSEKTVKTHVSNILAKLELADRTQAAVFAWRHGLVGEQGRE